MDTAGYILVLLALTGHPAEPHPIMKKFETLEGCQAAVRAAAAGGTLADCLPQIEGRRSGSTTARGEDTTKTPSKPPPPRRRAIPSKPGPSPLHGILTPPLD
jgi:hypothetical protein